ncbi:aquaporin-12-like [Seriola lalandi dorsalis]|uniref:Aquaporin n=1 Tax=Seriola lalandi dorsalis TaxID=1841481 RepID=A0A3B4XAL2_SERLL|nr:aquaporin-12-like [Seriola lalandi dorsalis]XP_056235198.1 aquaporin 12 isoform X2 [Seriola aureovittata]
MSGLNASLGYFVAVVIFAASVRTLVRKWPRFSFILEFASSFMLVACWLEVQTIVEVGEWAGGLGPDVTVTMLFVLLLTHGVICGGMSGNPTLAVQGFLQLEATTLLTLLTVVAQFLGAHLALLVAVYYWGLELTDMHMIKNLMARECSTSLLVSLLQGFFTECVCALIFHLVHLNLRRRSALIRVPLIAVLLTFLSHTARGYTSAYMNPSLAYGLTFHCPGFTFTEYAVVYWLSSLTGMTLALLLYMGHIPRIFAKNLFYFQKTRFRVPKGDKAEKKKQ